MIFNWSGIVTAATPWIELGVERAYAAIPGDVAEALNQERRHVEHLRNETREVASWLQQREQASGVAALYGH